MGKYIKTLIVREIAVNSEIVEWNYWDHEHLGFIHEGYNDTHILLSNSDTTIFDSKLKIPLTGFKINALTFQHRPKKNTILLFTTLFGALQKTLITIMPVTKNKTKIEMSYEFELPFYFSLFSKLIVSLVTKWNEKTWEEDLSLKLRRNDAIKNNFIDFAGIKKIKSKKISYSCRLPVPKPKDTYLDNHKFKYTLDNLYLK